MGPKVDLLFKKYNFGLVWFGLVWFGLVFDVEVG